MMIKRFFRDILSRYVVVSDLNRIKKTINKYPVVSFDIFDTLLRREVSSPSDVFDQVEKNIIKQHPFRFRVLNVRG